MTISEYIKLESRITLFICSFDRVATKHSGVGAATFGYLSSIGKLKLDLPKNGYDLECHALTNGYNPDVLGYKSGVIEKDRSYLSTSLIHSFL